MWSKTFNDNINPILNDLEIFYRSLPYPDLQKFNREKVEKSLRHLLSYIYDQTRNKDLSSKQCKDLIGTEMNKLIEGKHLKSLSTAMGVFVEGMKELIRPYVEEMENAANVAPVKEDLVKERSAETQKQKESFYSSYWEKFMPKSMLPTFKKIFGFPPELGEVEPTWSKMNALKILLEQCERVDLKIFQGKECSTC